MASAGIGRAASVAIGVFTAAYFLVAAVLLRRWLRVGAGSDGAAGSDPPLEPVAFLCPLKPGERSLARRMERFLDGIEPGDRVVFGASDARSRALCERLIGKFPGVDIVCPPVPAGGNNLNPKVGKLVHLAPFAGHDRWIVLDSDGRAGGEFLRGFRRDWQAAGTTAFSAPYVFGAGGGCVARMDAAATELSLWPGVAMLRAFGRVDFLTGACMAVRGSTVAGLGGWAAFADVLADDHELGRAVVRAGGTVGISRHVLTLEPPADSVCAWVLHQHRVFATFRVCNLGGSLGLPLTFGLAASFVAALARPLSARRWLFHLAILAARQTAAGSLPGRRRTLRDVWLSGLLEPVFWLLGQLPVPVRWAGKWINPGRTPGRAASAGHDRAPAGTCRKIPVRSKPGGSHGGNPARSPRR